MTLLALALALLIALPLGLYLGHRGRGELVAVGLGNAGRAIPELALIALVATLIGVGLLTVTPALAILGIPPILTNAFVGVRQVDPAAVDAARGIGMTELEVIRRVELPLAIPTIMGGVRGAAIVIVATATIAPLAGVVTLGDYIINESVYGARRRARRGDPRRPARARARVLARRAAASAHFERVEAAEDRDRSKPTARRQQQ